MNATMKSACRHYLIGDYTAVCGAGHNVAECKCIDFSSLASFLTMSRVKAARVTDMMLSVVLLRVIDSEMMILASEGSDDKELDVLLMNRNILASLYDIPNWLLQDEFAIYRKPFH